MHQHTAEMPERPFHVTLYGAGGTHLIQVNAQCLCGMWDWVRRLPGLPFVPEFMTVKELARSSRLSYLA